jgi:hypothetical protein
MLPMCFHLLTNHKHTPTYGAFTLDVKLVLNENPRWHPRWRPMLQEL